LSKQKFPSREGCEEKESRCSTYIQPNNNLMRFQEALSKKALEEYGTLGKLIMKSTIEEPQGPSRADFDLTDEYDKVTHMEE
jgi:hypothetical protein